MAKQPKTETTKSDAQGSTAIGIRKVPGHNLIEIHIATSIMMDAADLPAFVGGLCRTAGLREPDWAAQKPEAKGE